MSSKHIPVLLPEVIGAFEPKTGECYVDATVGEGGHSAALLDLIYPDGKLLGLDQDPKQIELCRAKLAKYRDGLKLAVSRFDELKATATKLGFTGVDGILMDLGFSSGQLNDSSYGLSLADEMPLDMRLSPEIEASAADLLNHANETEIADILFRYGDRHDSRRLARMILQWRRKHKFSQAKDLKEAIELTSPHVLAPIWQALRIWVNDEFGQIAAGLEQSVELLKAGGILAVITFHSGEDRLVKNWFKAHEELVDIVGKPISPRYQEILHNSRARSAKLRIVNKIKE